MSVKKYVTGDFQVNCYLVTDDSSKQCAIIDAGGICPQMENEIEANGLTVKYLIFTHGHFDHIGAAHYYAEKYGAKVLIHRDDAVCLTDERANFTYPAPYRFVPVKPDVLLSDGDEIEIGGLALKVIHTPGHTPGGISLYTDGSLFSGDTLFYRSVGRTDFPGGDFKELKKSVQKLFDLPDSTVVLPGHGCQTLLADEKYENPYVM